MDHPVTPEEKTNFASIFIKEVDAKTTEDTYLIGSCSKE
jgi:hypothetical protein